jgi:hypothetical protein
MKYDVLPEVNIMNTVFYDVTPCNVVDYLQVYSEDGGSRCLRNIVSLYQNILPHISEDRNLNIRE